MNGKADSVLKQADSLLKQVEEVRSEQVDANSLARTRHQHSCMSNYVLKDQGQRTMEMAGEAAQLAKAMVIENRQVLSNIRNVKDDIRQLKDDVKAMKGELRVSQAHLKDIVRDLGNNLAAMSAQILSISLQNQLELQSWQDPSSEQAASAASA